MHAIDYIILAFLAYALVRGFQKGLLKSVAALVGLALAVWCAVAKGHQVALLLADTGWIPPKWSSLLGFLLVFLAVFGAVQLLTMALNQVVKAVALKPADRILGSVFSALKVTLIAGVLITVVEIMDWRKQFFPELSEQSVLWSPLYQGAQWVLGSMGSQSLWDRATEQLEDWAPVEGENPENENPQEAETMQQ